MKRITVTLDDDVERELNKRLEKKEFDNYNQAIRRAIRIAFIEKKGEKKGGDCNASTNCKWDPEPAPVV